MKSIILNSLGLGIHEKNMISQNQNEVFISLLMHNYLFSVKPMSDPFGIRDFVCLSMNILSLVVNFETHNHNLNVTCIQTNSL